MGRGRAYTPEEDQLLISTADRMSLAKLANAMHRTPRALQNRLRKVHGWRGDKTQRQRAIGRAIGFHREQIARLFRVHRNQVVRWIRWGWLDVHYARAVTPPMPIADTTALITFLERGGALLPYLRPTDRFWRSMILDVRADLERQYIDRWTLADLMGLRPCSISHLMDHCGFPRPAIRMPTRIPHYYDRAAIRAWLDDHPQYITRRIQEEL